MIRAVLDSDHLPDWKAYDRGDVHEFLERRPLYFGHTFCYARDRIRVLPSFISDRLAYLPSIESEWPMRVYTDMFEFCDQYWKRAIRERVLIHLQPMEREHIREIEAWNLVRQ